MLVFLKKIAMENLSNSKFLQCLLKGKFLMASVFYWNNTFGIKMPSPGFENKS